MAFLFNLGMAKSVMARGDQEKIIDIVIPAYRVAADIPDVVEAALCCDWVRQVVVVDDACPDKSGVIVQEKFGDNQRVIVLTHDANMGVGGAMITGYRHAFDSGADIVLKVDGDGQMNPADGKRLVAPILGRRCDYAKGNRFYNPRNLENMPRLRMFGNSILSFVNKFSSGYWGIMDPTNGFTAIHRAAWSELDTGSLAKDYFFESDMLYQMSTINAVVLDVPMKASYGDEKSSLNIASVSVRFPGRYIKRFLKRVILKYFIREFNLGSLELVFGVMFAVGGSVFGIWQWLHHWSLGVQTPAGTVMLFGLQMIVGFQLLLSFLNYDINNVPSLPLMFSHDESGD